MRRVQVHALLSGPLGGTSFRSMIRLQAQKLKLVGWVMQHHDGRIELVANGSERNVRVLLVWCERGPLAELVHSLTQHPQPREAFFEFSVRATPPAPEPAQPDTRDDDEPTPAEESAR